MKYVFVTLGAIVVLFFVGWFVWALFFTNPHEESSSAQQTFSSSGNYTQSVTVSGTGGSAAAQQSSAVLAAYQQALSISGDPDNIKPYQNVFVSNYALQVWEGDHTGGQALMRFDSAKNQWTILNPGGGSWDADELIQFGVPTSTAQALITGLPSGN